MGLISQALRDQCPSEGCMFVCEGHLLSTRKIGVQINNDVRIFTAMHELVPGNAPDTWVWQEVILH